MSSRNSILQQVKSNKGEFIPLPEIPAFPPAVEGTAVNEGLLEAFVAAVRKNGGDVLLVNSEAEEAPLTGTLSPLPQVRAHNPVELEQLDTYLTEGLCAVAENGAVWINTNAIEGRILPFICARLLVRISATSIVATMHEAYARVTIPGGGFGVFIAGPSKTADIEQSLVIGAHGPLQHTVIVRVDM
ncbi:LutC/YkgG family protein [Flavihumibacter petaseus]|uniref:Lactate utilization protein C n=1 Tax=Flavihumibacter petaseus NBRC 106054 TaxID=1220578 RepID=A0A0E9MYK7_9BACT|nr:LUD domain-containing protein [Flavihumibacter petaseus]GAO42491.1 lactate utilization protein C [Flavihumibacter petaseus NBRC 106054]